MKKNYFMLAATTMMLAACAQTDVVNEIAVEETPQAIGFETFAQKATRAASEGETELYAHHESFFVWGYKMVPTTVTAFDKVTVRYNTSSQQTSTKWEYAPLRYWDKTATSYEFYAATPIAENWTIVTKDASNNELAAKDYYLTLYDFVLTDHDATNQNDRGAAIVSFNGDENNINNKINKDLMVSTSDTKFDLVDFTFKHILARLNVTVKKDEDFTETITITKFQVCNLKGQGDYIHKANPTWTANGNSITYNTAANCVLNSTGQYLLQSLVIPQTAGHEQIKTDGTENGNVPYIWIQYTIQNTAIDGSTAETFNAYYNLADVFGDTDLSMVEGNQYNLGITISPEAIYFTGDVTDWVVTNNSSELPIPNNNTQTNN